MDLGDLKYLDAPAKVLKLSTAMRIGCLIRPQSSRGDRQGKSCALQAAREAINGKPGSICDVAEWANETMKIPWEIAGQIIMKNDKDGFTREQIADWLESQGY